MLYRTKVFLILICTVGVSCGVLLFLCLKTADSMIFRLIQEKVLSIAVSTAPRIDGDLHETIISTAQDGNEAYLAIQKPLRESRDANRSGQLPVTFIYTIRPTTEGKWIFVVDAEEEGEDKSAVGDIVEFNHEIEIPKLHRAYVDDVFATDSYGTWLTAYAPFRDSTGEIVGLVGVDIAADKVIAQSRTLKRSGWIAFGTALLFATIGSVFLSRRVTAPLDRLGEQVRQIGEGSFDASTSVSGDEFGNLGKALNQMASALREREALKGALVRYVSTQAIHSVSDKDTIEDGFDEESRKVTVLAAGLTGINGVSDEIAAEQLYSLMTDWFSRTIDTVLNNYGTIEKSEGEDVAALFGMPLVDHGQERHAFSTALKLQSEFLKSKKDFNESYRDKIGIRIAIHTGTIPISQNEPETDYKSVDELITATNIIRKESSIGSRNGAILVSETSAKGLVGAIPLEEPARVETTERDISVHVVEMAAE